MARVAVRAWRWRGAGAGLSCLLATLACSCLVTDHAKFGEPIIPSNLTPLRPEGFARVPNRPDRDCDTTTPINNRRTRDAIEWMAFSVNVSDANVEDDLELRLVINGAYQQGSATDVAKTGTADRSPFTLCATFGALSNPCNRVEIIASSDFRGDPPYGTRYNDLARWEWWVLGPSEDYPEVKASDCAMQTADAGVLP